MLEFEAYASKVFGSDFAPYMSTSQVDAESGEYALKYFANREIVTRFAVLCGDAIHNLRVALDFAWYELTSEDSPASEHNLRFPIYPTRKHLEEFIRSREKQQSVVRLSRKLLDTIRPYKGGNAIGDLIYALHRLDIRDKHQLLIPQVQVSHIWEVCAEGRTVGEGTKVIYGPDIINTFGSKDKYEGQLSASIIFGEGAVPVEGKPVLQTIHGLETAVKIALMFLAYDE